MKLEDEEEEEEEVGEENGGNDTTNTGTSEKVKFTYYVFWTVIWCPCCILQDNDNAGSITCLLDGEGCIIVVSFPHVCCSVFLQLSM